MTHNAENDAPVRVGFRYQDGEVLSPEREAVSHDEELPEVVLDLGDGEWLTLAELRDLHFERFNAPGGLLPSERRNDGGLTHAASDSPVVDLLGALQESLTRAKADRHNRKRVFPPGQTVDPSA